MFMYLIKISHIFFFKIYMHSRQDITETNLKPALLEGRRSVVSPT